MLRVLEHKSDMASQFPEIKTLIINIFLIVINCTGSRLHKSVQMLDQRGLSGSGMSDHTDKLAIRYRQIDIF